MPKQITGGSDRQSKVSWKFPRDVARINLARLFKDVDNVFPNTDPKELKMTIAYSLQEDCIEVIIASEYAF